ncbi:hypothetical protein ES319_D01G053900v1 [Gossypium barbadense]|uniref:FBD domain-containing protein n=2 Tax=Gossypium TaxID=3633 RepID=A0A5J5SK01_GOSBA|nr:hypothetical protein ES319_D01G053900v1 [Gossypium barbadense]TYG82118.1 hypothetical protein ES288_D01G061700v1 [Gossypium darwinii]
MLSITSFCLRHVETGECGNNDIVPLILQKSPHLKHLSFNTFFFNRGFMLCPPERVPKCLTLHLEIIQIHILCGRKEAMKMIEYLLNNGRVLKQTAITIAREEGFNRLIGFSRASAGCKIVVTEKSRLAEADPKM